MDLEKEGVYLRKFDFVMSAEYNNFVSLGWFCGTASSLSKIGLRGASGPFDWLFSDYWAVLQQIKDGFKDFMVRENLETIESSPMEFYDKKYGFYCNHDIKQSFESEIEDIQSKYQRRAKRFLKILEEPTVLFRTIRDEDEIEFINHYWQYAERIIKEFNSQNIVVYVKCKHLNNLTNEVRSFNLDIEDYIGEIYEMRHMFASSKELMSFCLRIQNRLTMECNKKYDWKHNGYRIIVSYILKLIEQDKDGMDSLLLRKIGIEREEGLYIWGAGEYGMLLANYLRKRGVNIVSIIDNNHNKRVESGFKIISFDNVDDKIPIFIAVGREEYKKSIELQILSRFSTTKIMGFMDLYEEHWDL